MRRTLPLIALLLVLSATTAFASDGEARRQGSCSQGPGDWTLRVARVDANSLRVRFVIDGVAPGQAWHVYISDNGTGIFAGTKTSTSQGEVRVSKTTRNRSGTDRIAASGINTVRGTTCEGSVSY